MARCREQERRRRDHQPLRRECGPDAKSEEPVLGKIAISEYYQKLVANPNFVPFTLTVNSNSFHVVGNIAIETSVFEGDATRNGKQIHFRGKNLIVLKKQTGSW
jgi:ketosteroid isomerase-like protein